MLHHWKITDPGILCKGPFFAHAFNLTKFFRPPIFPWLVAVLEWAYLSLLYSVTKLWADWPWCLNHAPQLFQKNIYIQRAACTSNMPVLDLCYESSNWKSEDNSQASVLTAATFEISQECRQLFANKFRLSLCSRRHLWKPSGTAVYHNEVWNSCVVVSLRKTCAELECWSIQQLNYLCHATTPQ